MVVVVVVVVVVKSSINKHKPTKQTQGHRIKIIGVVVPNIEGEPALTLFEFRK